MTGRLERLSDRTAWILLGVAGGVSAALLLYLNRGTTFFFDEAVWFGDLGEYPGLDSILRPHNGHLHGTTRVLYLITSETFGTHYLIQRIVGVAAVLLASGLFFALARRRVGNAVALAPAILLLFYGSAWQHVVGPIGFTVVFSAAAGLAALLALERCDRRGEVLACAFICLSVFTFTVGLGFLVGVAIAVLLDRDRLRRAGIFLIPLAGYATWWLWARQFDQGRTTLSNIDHVPGFFADSSATISGALTGVNVPFSRFGSPAGITTAPPSELGWIAAAALVGAVIWRIARGNVPRSLWASLGVVSTYWLAASLSDPLLLGEQSDAVRYIYPGSIGVLLVATDVFRGIRIGPRAIAVVWAVGVFSIAMNLVFLRDGASYLRNDYTPLKREGLAMLELANGDVPGGSSAGKNADPRPELAEVIPFLGYGPGRDGYLAAVAEYGSPAYDLDQIRALSPELRKSADPALIQAEGITAVPDTAPTSRESCRSFSGGEVPLPPGGAYIRLRGGRPQVLELRRFSDSPGARAGTLTPGWTLVRIPTDAAEEPWLLELPPDRGGRLCPVAPTGES